MDFGYTPEQEELRRDVVAFIEEHVTDEVLAERDALDDFQPTPGSHGRYGPKMMELFARIGERGWLGIAYPEEYGGQGGDRLTQYIVEEEFMRAGINIGLNGSGAPAIMAAGTEEQKRYFIPRLISREISFCLGFTEPHAGADLASLRCRATPEGDDFVINGQKMYTTTAHLSTHIYLMARTDPDAPKREGISIFLIPMDTAGISIRPIWTIQNDPRAPHGTTYADARTNETFFDNVRVPRSMLLGEENKGWRVGSAGLNLDRVGAFRYLMSVRRDEDIVNLLKQRRPEMAGLADDAVVRDKVAELWTEAQVCRLMTMRSMSIVQRGGNFTYEGAAEKVWAPEHGVRTTEAIAQILGPYAQLLKGSPDAVEDGVYAHNVLGAFQSGINHGGVQIMRDQIARRGLGLPSARRARSARA
ncbi:acyl-CoA dehydrogenase family protein [Roseitranquillus sediminis]|uniref:acyl-CoA dehydrogenase family protein n=1 Tax=Roseitranquillus sediminis TaxID=2809051 RepID=UPI001D0C513E|nr:acyl-CoA dehydrogenase family protein [Roseitranquillus sediminis]MBM9594706.1 acyl-CoA dehydrogenase family protein [Roseitranquillus sediminis]